jgi:aminoglycoside phosphotransferase (APT) family kinase protein
MDDRVADMAAESMARVGHHLEERLLGTSDPATIEQRLADLCAPLGAIRGGLFYEAGVGLVVGLRLVDDRSVVVKLHWWNASHERLAACLAVQAHLHDAGVPAPRPQLPVMPLGAGFATVEELLTGDVADGHRAEVRTAMAVQLHQLIESTRSLPTPDALDPVWCQASPESPLFPTPHDTRFDFEASADGAEWIDELGRQGFERLRRAEPLPRVIGHTDWRVQNMAFDGERIVAIYDWDSVAVAPEPVFVGSAAAVFPTDWRVPHPDPPPTVDQMHSFVADYETARGHPFSAAEREVLDAANLAGLAYSARCQHSDIVLRPEMGDSSKIGWPRLLRDRGARCFT